MDPNSTVTPPPAKSEPRARRFGLWITGAAAIVVALVLGAAYMERARREEEGARPAAPVPAQAPAAPLSTAEAPKAPTAPAAAAPAGCEKDLDEIRKLHAAVPESFTGLSGEEIKTITEKVQRCRQLSEAFIADCKGAAGYHEAQAILARILLSLHRVEWSNFVQAQLKQGKDNPTVARMRDAWSAGYFRRIQELGEAGLAGAEKGSALRAECLDLLGDAYTQGGSPAKGLEHYEKLLEEYPTYRRKNSIYLAQAQAHRDTGNAKKGLEVVRKALKEFPDDANFPFYMDWQWRLVEAGGDLEGMLAVAQEALKVYPERLKKEGLSKSEREACERYLYYSGFRVGYALFALGRFPEATAAFREHLAYTDRLTKERGGQIPQDFTVYAGRSRDNLQVLETKIGKPAPADLREVKWAGAKPALDGRPQVILFRNYGDERSGPILKALDRHWRERRQAYDLSAVAFQKGGTDPEGQLQETFREAQDLGLDCAVGLDPDSKGKALFVAFDATVGSATLCIVDRAGSYVWFQQDPRDLDQKFSIAILERILKN